MGRGGKWRARFVKCAAAFYFSPYIADVQARAAPCDSSGVVAVCPLLWAYVLVFRRPGFCLLSSVYRDVERAKQRWRRENASSGASDVEPPFEAPLFLSRASCLELLDLVLLAASWGSDMRTEYPDILYASDAFSSKMATCVSEPLGQERVRACWGDCWV